MAVILTGAEYVDLDAHGAALDIRQRPLAFYAELLTTATQIMLPFSHGRMPGGEQEWSLFVNISDPGRVTGRWENSGGTLLSTPHASAGLNDGNLHRVLAVVRTSQPHLDVYVDGSLITTNAGLGGNVNTADYNNLTRIGMDPGTAGREWVGQISNVALWDAEITDADAQDLTIGSFAPGDFPTGLQGWWPLDFDARDVSGNDRHGTLVGSPTFTESGAITAELAIGVTLSATVSLVDQVETGILRADGTPLTAHLLTAEGLVDLDMHNIQT